MYWYYCFLLPAKDPNDRAQLVVVWSCSSWMAV